MTAQVEAGIATPVGEVGMLRQPLIVRRLHIGGFCQTGLPHIGGEQAVDIVLHEHVDVLLHGRQERRFEEGDLRQLEMLGI